ncbi:hypothetical protein Airi01_041980 [Actinoallomurus iriomotensis]|uniref:Uncharacterized protein n=1 Tax=Actinoallomurus iriomotensis TaxID=478107 RepID=A0A9W6RH18_9ACTN|nr:hypothetical protein Airi01_041980 [Actinoallomurus iriomotensis]
MLWPLIKGDPGSSDTALVVPRLGSDRRKVMLTPIDRERPVRTGRRTAHPSPPRLEAVRTSDTALAGPPPGVRQAKGHADTH